MSESEYYCINGHKQTPIDITFGECFECVEEHNRKVRSEKIDKACAICKKMQSEHSVKMSDKDIREYFENTDSIFLEYYLESHLN